MKNNNYTNIELGERFRDLRKKHGLTQEKLANALNITRSAVNGWEMGQSMPSTNFIIQLSNIYKVSSDYLLGLSYDETIDISGLNNENKKIILSLVKSLNNEKSKTIAASTLKNNGHRGIDAIKGTKLKK